MWGEGVKTVILLDKPVNFTSGEHLRIEFDPDGGRWEKVSTNGEVLDFGELKEAHESKFPQNQS